LARNRARASKHLRYTRSYGSVSARRSSRSSAALSKQYGVQAGSQRISKWLGTILGGVVYKTPPALAPGALIQLGLIGLVYTYQLPALAVTETYKWENKGEENESAEKEPVSESASNEFDIITRGAVTRPGGTSSGDDRTQYR